MSRHRKAQSRQSHRERRQAHQNRQQPENLDSLYESSLRERVPAKKRKPIEALNVVQGQLIASILAKDITFATGPAGTGKTYVAAALAAEELDEGRIERIVITRPMKECEEDMGFLPGEANEKYAPWVAPIVDVLEERLGKTKVASLIKYNRIQYSPLMMMRGKSFKKSWVLLDEAQNVTPGQMKMFLTRLGEGSKAIITGDLEQSDMRDGRGIMQENGLNDALFRVGKLPEIGHVEFEIEDCVRHGLVRKILEQYRG